MRRLSLWTFVIAVALAGCGDDTSKTPSNNNPADMGASDSGDTPDGDNNQTDAGGGGDDTGGGGDDTGGGGDDTGGGGDDMGGGDMSTSECGNGIVEGAEACDDGNDDADDLCNDDCTFTCGDGVVGANEACDTAIADGNPGACPTACDDGEACTMDTLQGSECTAECVFGDIAACVDDDGCCASTCNATNDNDCSPMCGNGVVEGTEVCDGDCPVMADCADADSCTADVYTGSAGTCDAMCANNPITACVDADGCCPPACDATTDDDCSATCGNGTVEAPELCDGSCPSLADCDDGDACTTESLTGSAGNCNAACSYADVTVCDMTSDGCCPSNCNSTNDIDCTAICGNGSVEAGEQCDDGNTATGDGCDATCQFEAVAFRLSDLDLRDPHVYADLPFFGCSDITNSVPLNLSDSINQLVETAITTDDDGDGELDLSFILIFRPLEQTDGASAPMDVAEADCTAPIGSTTCTVDTAAAQSTTYTSDANDTCLDVIMGTVSGYTPAVTASTAPCWSSLPVSFTVNVSGIQIPLDDTQVAATFPANPATSFTNGMLRGFISEETADQIVIPADIAVVGGSTLSQLLPGGDPPDSNTSCTDNADCTQAGETCANVMGGRCQSAPNCATTDDRDMNNGVSGWWFYFNFPADQVPFTEL